MLLSDSDILFFLSEINSAEEIKRRSESLKSYSIFEGELHEFVLNGIKQLYPKTWADYNIADYNLLKKITEKKSKSYIKPPTRKLEQVTETDKYKKILSDFNYDDTMKVVDQYKNQYRYCGLGVLRNRYFDIDGNHEDVYQFSALAPHEFVVHRDNEKNIIAWSIPKGKDGDYYIWTMWTDQSQVKIRTRDYKSFDYIEISGNQDNINPFGMIPYVYVPMAASSKYPLAPSLPRQTIEVNKNLSVYLTSGNMQVGQLVISHPQEQKIEEVSTGITVAMNLPQSSKEKHSATTAAYISPNPNLEGHKDSVLTYMMLVLDENGMNSNSSIKSGETFTSGFDRLIANADVQDIIEDNQGMYSKVENETYQIIKHMNDVDGNYTFKSEKLSITYALPKILTSDSEKLDNLKKKKDLRLWEEWELVQEADPNLTEEEAKEKVKRLKAENGNKQESSIETTESESAAVA
jgi:hypothetical protein